ncbi:hypothetical protein M422DRAFT_271099, partial [Sphaerobolus stellatus SS14]
MPPKAVAAGTKDIRSFFGGASQSKATTAKSNAKSSKIIEISDDDEKDKPVTPKHFTSKPAASAGPSRSNAAKSSQAMDIDPPAPQPSKPSSGEKRKKPTVNVLLSSDSESDPEPP